MLQALRDDIYDAVVDPKLANEYNLDEMLRMVVCVLACVDHAPGYRPKILEVYCTYALFITHFAFGLVRPGTKLTEFLAINNGICKILFEIISN